MRRGAALLIAVATAVGAAGCASGTDATPTASAGPTTIAPVATVESVPTAAATSTSTSTISSASTSTSLVPTTTATTVAATTTTATTTTVPAPRRVTMAFTGDTLTHSPLWRQAARNAEPAGGYDFRPMLAGLAPLLADVDLAVCHLETPIAPIGEELSTSPRYGVPAEITDAIAAAGFDRCSTASNHAADRGTAGVDRTVDALRSAGLGQSGMARRPEEIEPAVFTVRGVDVAHLSYTFGYNGLSFPDDQPWRSAIIDPVRIVDDARTARSLGAEVVVVSMHWGAEGRHDPTVWQRRIADEITVDGLVDLVVGHHAHVVQPIEQVNGTWVLFGLGNILSNLPTSSRWPEASQDAVVANVAITVDHAGVATVDRPAVVATWVDKEAGWIVRLVDDELRHGDPPSDRRERLEASRTRTARVLAAFLAESAVS